MKKHLAIITAAIAVLAPTGSAQAATIKSKVRFSATSFAASEDAGSATLTVTRSARNGKSKSATSTVASVGYSTSNGTAVAGLDYTATSGRLTFPACPNNPAASDPCLVQSITVPIADDNVIDGNKTVRVSLTSPSRNATVVNPQKTTLTIADNEGPTRVSFDAPDYRVWELGPQVELHVIRSGAGISGSSSVDLATANDTATAPGDYTAKSATLSFAPGEVDKTVKIDIADDAAVEPSETFSVNLSNASAGTSIDTASAPVTILDDDTPVTPRVELEQATYTVGEGGDVTLTVNRTAGVDSAVSVDYATVAQSAGADIDFSAVADTLEFDPGDTSQSFTVATTGDSLHEGDETFAVNLSNAIPAGTVINPASATITITDDDPIPTIGLGSTTTGNGTVTVVVELSNPTTGTVTVIYIITDGSGNQVGTGTATVQPGQTGTTVQVPVSGDGPFTVTITNPTGGTIDPADATAVATPPAVAGTPRSSDPGTSTDAPAEQAAANTAATAQPTPAATNSQAVLDAKLGACRLRVMTAKRVDRRRGLTVKLRAGHTCTATLGASVKGKQSKASKVVRALKTKRQTVRLRAGKTQTVKLRFSKRALGFIKRALNARRPMTLTLVVIERNTSKHVSKRTFRTKLRR